MTSTPMTNRLHRHLPWACRGLGFALLLCQAATVHAQVASPVPALGVDSAVALSTAQTSLVESLEARIALIESEFGPFDPALLEPLDTLARALREAGSYERAAALYDQQLQIHRINQGLYSADQIPIVESLLQLHAEQNDWEGISATLGYLTWLYQRDNTLEPEARLAGMSQVGNWHLRSLGKDGHEREAYHLVELAKIDERTTALAEELYGLDSLALTPYLYNQALSDLYIALAITLTNNTSQELMLLTEGIRNRPSLVSPQGTTQLSTAAEVEAMYGSRASSVIERSFKNNMQNNQGKLERIQSLFEDAGDTEAVAIALIYRGDSTLMRQQFEARPGKFAGMRRGSSSVGSAMMHYEEGLAKLAEAGSNESAIAQFTRCPVMLPVSTFHTRLDEAIMPCERDASSGMINLGEYSLFSTLVPGLEGELAQSDGSISATVQFSVRTNGQVSNHEIVHIEPDDTTSRVQVRKLLEILQFRPAIVAGEAVRVDQLQLHVTIPGNE